MAQQNKNFAPCIVIIIILVIFGFAILYRAGRDNQSKPTAVNYAMIPVAAEKLKLGTGILKPGDRLILDANVPAKDDMPLRYEYPNIKVHTLLGESGPVSVYQRADIKTYVLEVPQDTAAELLSALAMTESVITYQIVTEMPASTAQPTLSNGLVRVTIPLDRFTTGTGPFDVNDVINLSFYVSGDGGTTTPMPSFENLQVFENLKVIELLSVNGPISFRNWGALKKVVLAVPVDEVAALEEALAKNGKLIEYRIQSVTATTSATPEVTPTNRPTPITTPALVTGWTYMYLSIAEISQLGNFNLRVPQDARLAIVYKKTDGSLVSYANELFCVTGAAFLDENGENAGAILEKGRSKQLLFLLKIDDLARYAQAMASQTQIYLVPDAGCNLATPTATASIATTLIVTP